MDMDYKDYYRLHNPVRALRKETGITQVELAKRLNSKQPSISRKETGEDTTIKWLQEAARRSEWRESRK
jgi:transcriptional regulator with XRE-family HTH domain